MSFDQMDKRRQVDSSELDSNQWKKELLFLLKVRKKIANFNQEQTKEKIFFR